LEVVRTLLDHDIEPDVPLVVANITNEEGARFEPAMMASGILSGRFDKATMFQSKDTKGITFKEALKSSGFEGKEENRLTEAAAFLELHIEQGPVLEAENKQIGVVEGVMGMVNYEVEVLGDSNHAGTTPMHLRKDALFAANDLISETREKMSKLEESLVFTIGRLDVSPNIHTVIPNRVAFTIEARHKDSNTIQQVEEIIEGLPASGNGQGCTVHIRKQWDRDTVWFDDEIVHTVENAAKNLGYSYKRMISGAGHDAQFISTYIPTAMIFVPSIRGKSHSEDELTPWEDCEKGANVLLHSVLRLVRS
jgi:N-carbamoyl-L-amino-acid hydrolase